MTIRIDWPYLAEQGISQAESDLEKLLERIQDTDYDFDDCTEYFEAESALVAAIEAIGRLWDLSKRKDGERYFEFEGEVYD